jgi:hypothetical protein
MPIVGTTGEIPMPPLAKEYLAACIALRDKEQAEEERRHAAELDVTHKLLEAAKYRENMERQAKLEAEQESAAANQTSSNWRLTSIITGVIALFSVLRECKKISEPDVSGLNGMVKLHWRFTFRSIRMLGSPLRLPYARRAIPWRWFQR